MADDDSAKKLLPWTWHATTMLCLALAGFGVGLVAISAESRPLALVAVSTVGGLSTVFYVLLCVKGLRRLRRGRTESGARGAVRGVRWFFEWLP
ncbi:hypothetical protein ABZU32_16740 [Sphaerisporangium sp. NPDC005288]|uniref:hypothetical protein n=1 Tax=Sphaerisporangium sp. NPDC005288 TaxID=3155114 RepID=UPI0033AE5945